MPFDTLTNSSDVSLEYLPSVILIPALDNTFGAYLLGTTVGLALFGFLLHQVVDYFRSCSQDALLLKCLVVIVLSVTAVLTMFLLLDVNHRSSLLETFTAVLNIHACYYYLVASYFMPQHLLGAVWSLDLSTFIFGATVFACQCFYMRRVFLLGRRYRPIASIAGLFATAALGFNCAATVKSWILREFTYLGQVTWLISVGSVCIVVADTLLTSTLIFVLHRSRTGFNRTDSMIQIIIVYTINTGKYISFSRFSQPITYSNLLGLVNNASTLLLFVFAIVYPKNLIFASVGIVSTRIYANSFITTSVLQPYYIFYKSSSDPSYRLNSRKWLSERGMCTFGIVTEFPTLNFAPDTTGARQGFTLSDSVTSPQKPNKVKLQSFQLQPWKTPSDTSRGPGETEINFRKIDSTLSTV
ncbi:hypothetical protein C8Q76DRAFT_793306 [Earliella scabrosa]|nr:hypothetical protein C8Q76DRAFT_793306 [Earliella scabrosa]